MKNLNYLLVIALCFAVFSCKDDDNGTPPQQGKILLVPDGEIESLVSVSEAAEMEAAYLSEFYGLLNEMKANQYEGYDGAVRDIWFDLDEIKRYIYYVEEYAEANGHDKLGLRIYLGAKDQLGQDGQVYPRQTVFFVPTTETSVDGQTNQANMIGASRMNYGNAGVPDDVFSDVGIP